MNRLSAEVGVKLFKGRASELVLVIVDMTMPKLNGEETVGAALDPQ